MALSDGMRLLAASAADTRRKPRVLPYWAHVAAVGPLRVTLDDDPSGTLLEVACNGVGPLKVDDPVLVQIAGGRAVVIATPSLAARVTALEPSAWTAIPLASGWTALDTPQWRARGGVIELAGRVEYSGAIPASFVDVGQLPPTARPAVGRYYAAASGASAALAQVAVIPSGMIRAALLPGMGAATRVSLDGIGGWDAAE